MQPEATAPQPIEANATTWAAAILVGLEGIAVAALAGWMMPSLIAGDTTDLGTAWALILMTVIAAVALFAFAIAILRDHGWGRSGAIVAQLLILAVALGAAAALDIDCQIFDSTMVCDNEKERVKRGEIHTCSG